MFFQEFPYCAFLGNEEDEKYDERYDDDRGYDGNDIALSFRRFGSE